MDVPVVEGLRIANTLRHGGAPVRTGSLTPYSKLVVGVRYPERTGRHRSGERGSGSGEGDAFRLRLLRGVPDLDPTRYVWKGRGLGSTLDTTGR